ncbi:alpha-L-fucosidase [Tamlana agarivorans]|uniref:Alpha-L-fucosidase n=1 Tax=Pseudotamlana agarivorans TaxID=481183 RepID=A0ACC5U9F6_9FLAO|nr:alpha-L-fucosidase [Tamlana agarivorans]MBU2950884.1 alpha-L-fucosidase [Tamlana agarivorans]
MKKGAIYFIFSVLLLSTSLLSAQKTTSQRSNDTLMGWFRDAKFGMFIHFGAETPEHLQHSDLTRTQKYEAAVKAFNPVDFDANKWVGIAKNAGMKYIVFTTKHHDGFCKWDSKLTDWDVIDQTPFKRDILAELAAACKAADIKLGFYYSIADWHHPEYDPKYSNRKGFHFYPNKDADITKYMDYMYGQIKELCENYQPKLFWFDGSSGFRNPNRKRLLGQQEMVDLLNSYGAISNSRLGDDDALKYVNYLSMGDNMAPSGNIGVDFESAQTMNNSWHYNPTDNHWKSPKLILEKLIDIVGNGGNYLLNVGPDAKGVIPEESKSRLEIVGEWLQKNGEAIYGTKASPYPYEFNWGSMTTRQMETNTILYLSVANWPKDGDFNLFGLSNKVLNVSLLDSGEPLLFGRYFNADAGISKLQIEIPKKAPNSYVSVIKMVVEGTPVVDQAFIQQQDGTVILDAFRATIHDKVLVSNKPRRPIGHRLFTVPKKGVGVMPARGMTVGLNQMGDALHWDFRIMNPGTYKVAVICSIKDQEHWNPKGKMKVTVAGHSVENKLIEDKRWDNQRMATEMKCVQSILGTVTINHAGMHTLSAEVTANFTELSPKVISIQLIPMKID